MNKKGQVLILFAAFLFGFLAIIAFVIDGGLYMQHWQSLQVDLDIACVAAGTLGSDAFQPSLDANGVLETAALVVDGADMTYIATAEGDHKFYLAQFMGIRGMSVSTETRCLRVRSGVLPIAVQESWYLDSHDNGTEYPILGQGVDANDAPCSSFSGALYSHIWCADGAPCNYRQYHEPLIEEQASASCQPNKDLVKDSFEGSAEPIFVPVGTTVPHVNGVSNNKLVKALKRGGWKIGDHLYVAIFDGHIDRADQGSCNNLEIMYYVEVEITSWDNNTVNAVLAGEPLYNEGDLHDLDQPSRVVPMDWGGPAD